MRGKRVNLPNMLERKGGIFLQCERGKGEPIFSVRGKRVNLPNMLERKGEIFLQCEMGKGGNLSPV